MDDAIAASAWSLGDVPRPALLTQTPHDETRRPIVIVLGMHRSGTSLCSHVLSVLGVDMADQAGPGDGTPTPDNAKGYWERWEITDLHDRVLGLLNRDYWTPTHDFGMPVAWWADPQVIAVRREMAEFLKRRIGDAPFGFKDPRTVRLMPLWHQLMRELQLSPKLIFCLRNPAQVARSLLARDRVDTDIGEARWFSYVLDFFRYNRRCEFCLIEYEHWFEDVSVNLNKLTNFLDLHERKADADLERAVSSIVDAELRHDSGTTAARNPAVRSLYELARRSDRDAAALQQIDHIIAQFTGFQQLQGGIHRLFEHIFSRAVRLKEVEQQRDEQRAIAAQAAAETAALRLSLTDCEARLALAEQRAEATDARIQELTADIESAQRQLAATAQQRDAEAAAAAQAEAETAKLRASLADREAILAGVRRRADAADTRVEELTADIESVQCQLAATAQQRDAGAVVAAQAEAETAELRARVADRETMLAQTSERIKAAEARLAEAGASADAEILSMRRTLAQLEEELRAATTARDLYLEKLAASLDVSSRLLQALQRSLLPERFLPPVERWYRRLRLFRRCNGSSFDSRKRAVDVSQPV
jgi:hypothetical protein